MIYLFFHKPIKAIVLRNLELTIIFYLLFQYATLKKATSSDPGDTPGYVYDELVNITYSDIILATQIAIYLADSLDTSSSKLRTAKTLHHLIRKGSRQFRKTLRSEKDEILRKAANSSDPLVAKVMKESREILFDEALIAQDDLMTEEIPPQPTLSGMGASSDGKGFGNAPISKENLGHKVLDFIDKTVNFQDQREEVLKMCLAPSSVGEYQSVQMSTSISSTSLKTSIMKASQSTLSASVITGKKHVPGKAGGGWNSSEDEEAEVERNDSGLLHSMTDVSLNSPLKSRDLMIDSAW